MGQQLDENDINNFFQKKKIWEQMDRSEPKNGASL